MRSAVVPLYILLCIVLGGSRQGMWGMAILQLLGVAILGWSLLVREHQRLSTPSKHLFAVAALMVLLPLIQLIPLPPDLWTLIPGREPIVKGYRLLGQPVPWLPISVTPYRTAEGALTLLPSLAVLAGMLIAGAYRRSWLVVAVLIGTFAAVLLGALQVGSSDPTQSEWYLYRVTNHGYGTGFFANSNHMATLLVISVPLLVALIAQLRKEAKNPRAGSGVLLLAVAGALVLLVGIFVNESLAVLLLGLPVLLISTTMLLPRRLRLGGGAAVVALLSIGAMLAVYLTPLQDQLIASNSTSFEIRQKMWSTTIPAVEENWLLGSGLGSFPKVYALYENHQTVDRTFVNHAHNDYLEVVLETGIPGILLVLALLLWWVGRLMPIWRAVTPDGYAQAASIASAAILAHSLVDYPLRTTTLSAILAACLALMAQPRPRPNISETTDLWPSRHATV